MIPLYKNKWVNADCLLDSPAFVTVAIGARGIGKTYGCLKELYERGEKFLYVRRTQTQLDETCIQSLNPYNRIAADCGYNICCERLGKHSVGFYNAERGDGDTMKATGEPFAVGVALSTFATIRGMSLDVTTLLFDEVIPERHERPIKAEGEAFLNMLESVNRNRELSGGKPLHVILLSNSNTINSEILNSIGILKTVDEMSRRGVERKTINDGLIEIIMFRDSPISEEKKQSALYRVANNTDFSAMALDNNFARSDYEQVQARPLKEYNMLCSVGDITICKHKSKREYYIIDGAKAAQRFDNTPISVSNFKRTYNYIYMYYLKQRVFFASVTAKIYFERMYN